MSTSDGPPVGSPAGAAGRWRAARVAAWAWLAGRPGRFAERACCRLLRAAERDEPSAIAALVRLAAPPGRRRGAEARAAIAAAWVRGRDPVLRAAVLRTGAVAAERVGPPGGHPDPGQLRPYPITLALHGRLAEAPPALVATMAPDLLADPDPDVRAGTERACATAAGPLLVELWHAVATAVGAGTATARGTLLAAVLANPAEAPQRAVDAAWQVWLAGPDERVWARLAGRPAVGEPLAGWSRLALGLAPPARLCAAVLDADAPHPVLRRVLAICAERGLAPADLAQRAAFFLLTGRPEQHRALDPDGDLVSAAYRAAPPALRTRLRAAMVTAGDLDVLRVIATGPGADRLRGPDPDERGHLVGHLVDRLADRRDWPALWRLITDLPLAEAVPVAHRIEGWRPADPADLALLLELRATRPEAVAPDRLRRHTAAPVRVCPLGPNRGGWFSAGGRRLVVLQENPWPGLVATVYRLPEGDLVPRPEWPTWPNAPGGPYRIIALVPTEPGGDGYAAVTSGRRLLLGAGAAWPRSVDLVAAGVCRAAWWPGGEPTRLAADPAAGLLAIGGSGQLALLNRQTGGVAAATAHPGPRSVLAVGRDRLLSLGWLAGEPVLTEWRAVLGRLVRGATSAERVLGELPPHRPAGLARLAPPEGGDVVAAVADGMLQFFDTDSLRPVPGPVDTGGHQVWDVWAAPGGDLLAVDLGGEVRVYGPLPDPLVPLLRRPATGLGPADLAAVGQLAGRYTDPSAVRSLALLRVWLEHRLRAEIELGTVTAPFGADHEISL